MVIIAKLLEAEVSSKSTGVFFHLLEGFNNTAL